MSGALAAVLLAGGRSRRMGRDKALLPLPDGRLLWERQLAILRALQPAELFISGFARAGFPTDATVLRDEAPDRGPLAGIVTALRAMKAPRLVVLAIDLPAMTSGFLQSLLSGSGAVGVVPQTADGRFEPLAAVYPREALAAAEKQLGDGELSLQSLVRFLIDQGLMSVVAIRHEEAGLFTNWNDPADVTL